MSDSLNATTVQDLGKNGLDARPGENWDGSSTDPFGCLADSWDMMEHQ